MPDMNKQLVKRLIIGLFLIAVLFTAYKILERMTIDPDPGTSDTTGMVAATEFVEGGSKVVVFAADGTKREVPGYKKGESDVEPVWRPDGQRLFISSNRKGRSNNIFRWNLATNKVEQRSHGSRGEGGLYFGPPDWPHLENSGLITAGGVILDFDQMMQQTHQVLPPSQFAGSNASGEESGSGTMDATYERIGLSFRSAKWGAERKVIYSVMRRDADEVFVISYMEPFGGQTLPPIPLLAGQSIQFDVGADGTAVVSIQGFDFVDDRQIPPDFIKDGKAVKPYRNSLMSVKIGDDGRPIVNTLFTDQPDLGIDVTKLTDAERLQAGVPNGIQGVIVNAVAPQSAAETIGMETGDVLQKIGDTEIAEPLAMMQRLSQVRLDDKVAVTYYSKKAKAVKTVEYAFGAEPSLAIRQPAVSPDMKVVAAVLGTAVDQYTFKPRQLVLVPLTRGDSGTPVVSGAVYDPNWSPDGKKIAYTKLGPAGDAQVYTINRDGSNETNVSGPGDFANPKFSPMLKQ